MKLSQGIAAILLSLGAVAAHAEVTATVTATSDYDFRGITQTAQKPALQGSIDYAHSSGFYAGVWGSNVDFGNCCNENIETDIYAGWKGGDDTITYDLGGVYYTYPGAHDLAYPEIYAGATYKWFTGKIWYSWDFGQSGQSAEYYQLDGNFPLPQNFAIAVHTGYSDGDYWGSDSYFDWSAGVSYQLGQFNLSLKWIDGSDFKPGNHAPDDVGSSDARAVFSISTTFPWAKE